nr:hypothetical protein [Burkholderia anthina]
MTQYCISYEHSLRGDPDNFIVRVPTQIIESAPANIPLELLPDYFTELILERSPLIAKIRNLRVL